MSFLELPPRKVKLKDGRQAVLRPPNPADAGKLLDLVNAIVEEDTFLSYTQKTGYGEEAKWLNEKLGKMMRKKSVMLVAEAEGRIVGNCEVVAEEGKYSHVGLFGIVVAKDFRSVGLGKVISEETLRLAKEFIQPRLKLVELSVFGKNNPATLLYKKLGFSKEAVLKKRILHRGKYCDKVYMSRPI